MPLCDRCKSQAEVQPPMPTVTHSYPPHGMDWGETCDRCGQEASVTL